MKIARTIIVASIVFGILLASSSCVSLVKAVADVDILSHTGYLDSLGYYHVAGEALNAGDKVVNFVMIEVKFYDSNGAVIDTIFDLTMLDVLLVDRKSPFDIVLRDATQSANVDHYSIAVTFSTTTPIATGLEILAHSSYIDESECMHIIGEIKNVANERARIVKVIATYYDASGGAVAAELAYLDPIERDLDPGQTRPFEISLSEERTQYVKTYELTAESTQYAIILPDQCKLALQIIGGGQIVPAPGTYQYSIGTTVTVDAIPNSGWTLSHWLLDSLNVGSADPITVTMDTNHTLTAVFVKAPQAQYTLIIGVYGSGATNPAPDNYKYNAGMSVSVAAIPDSGWVFSYWLLNGSNVGSTNPYQLNIKGNYTLTAVFGISPVRYNLTLQVSGNGTTSPLPGTSKYDKGTLVNVTAIPDSKWILSYWLLNDVNVGSENPYKILMNSNHNLTAVFVKVQLVKHTLTIEVDGSGTTDPAPGTYSYDKDSTIVVAAVPHSKWMLKYWLLNGSNVGSTNPYTVTVSGNLNLTAVFVESPVPLRYTLTIEVTGSGTTSPQQGSHVYTEGTIVSVAAIPDSGWVFSYWLLNGSNVGSNNPYQLNIKDNYTLTAVYAKTSEFTPWAFIVPIFAALFIALFIYKRMRSK